MEYVKNELLPVLIPTPNGNMPIKTMMSLFQTAYLLKRAIEPFSEAGNLGIPAARTHLFKKTREFYDNQNVIRGLMIDSDIVFDRPDILAEYIEIADKNNWNLVGNYMHRNTNKLENTVYYRDENQAFLPYTIEQYKELDDLSVIESAGLGFYYGDLPLNYKFHSSFNGEDVNFFDDNKLEIRIMKKLNLGHQKMDVLYFPT